MKISQDKYESSKKTKVEKDSNSRLNVLLKELINTIDDKEFTIDQDSLLKLLKSNNELNNKNSRLLVKYLGEKIDNITKSIKAKPTSFIFDVRRDSAGYINTVLVKPNKINIYK